MAREPIPEDVRRFILTSIISVPYLEALLLLRNAPNQWWESATVAQRLYIVRLVAYGLILVAILDKNQPGRKSQ